MPRPKPDSTDRLIAFLEADASSPEDFEAIEKLKQKRKIRQTFDEKTLEAEAVLLYFHTQGKDFIKQKCPECDEVFAYKYHIPGMQFKCTNECRRAALEKIGIEWTPNKSPEERWGMSGVTKGVIPLIISPTAYATVESKLQESREDSNSPVA